MPPLAVGALLCVFAAGVWAQPSAGTTRPASTATNASATADASPRWNELAQSQRRALKPLAAGWSSLSVAQKRKWIALSRNFEKLSDEEQGKLQARMNEWVGLSSNERSLARLNFAATKKLPLDEKQAKWQAYQALSDDERRVFAEQAPRQPVTGAATAVRPEPKQRLANVQHAADNRAPMPKISSAPHLVDRNTLLPQVDRYDSKHATP